MAYTNGTVDRIEYVWGLDLSGTMQGAGSVGGLLFEKRNGQIFVPIYDAGGNIAAYIDEFGQTVAQREYDVFGNTVSATGPMVNDFNFWFSTKYLDHETGSTITATGSIRRNSNGSSVAIRLRKKAASTYM